MRDEQVERLIAAIEDLTRETSGIGYNLGHLIATLEKLPNELSIRE